MKYIVVYNSDCGSSKRYAIMLANNLACNCQDIKKRFDKNFETLIFVTNIKMNKLQKIKKIQKFANKNHCKLVVLGVGITNNIVANNCTYEQFLKKKNQLEDKIEFFYLQGQLDKDKISKKIDRFLIDLMYKNIKDSANKSVADNFFVNCYENKVDFVSKQNLIKVLQYINKVSCKNIK